MAINRIAAQKIIEKIPTELRSAARKERKALIEATKRDPIGTAFEAAHGKINFLSNQSLKQKLQELNNQMATESYSVHQAAFLHRQPSGIVPADKAANGFHDVVKASTYLN